MQIVTLEQIKWELNITHTAQDSRLTDLANRVEGEALARIGQSYDALVAQITEAAGGTEFNAAALAPLQAAVLWVLKSRFHGKEATFLTGFGAQLIIPYALPKFSSGTTA